MRSARFLRFLRPDRAVIGVPLFPAVSLITVWLQQQGLQLEAFNGEAIGIATLDGVDIGARVSLFYKALFFFSITFFAIGIGLNGLLYKFPDIRADLKTLNAVSLGGLSLHIFNLFDPGNDHSLGICLFGFGVLLLITLIKHLIRPGLDHLKMEHLVWLAALAYSLNVLLHDVLVRAGFLYRASQFHLLLVGILALLFVAYVIVHGLQSKLEAARLARAGRSLLFLPILSVASTEFYLIANQRGIDFGRPGVLYGLGLLLILYFVFSNFLKKKKLKSLHDELQAFYLPVTLFNMVLISYYQPFVAHNTEMFELANPANGIMRLFRFGELPVLEGLSSHLLSEQVFGYIYILLNGYDGSLAFTAYDFLHNILYTLIVYFFLSRILPGPFTAFFMVLLIPFIGFLFPPMFVMALPMVFLLHKLYHKYSFKRLLLLGGYLAGLLLWRLDVGIAAVPATALLLLCFALLRPEQFRFRDLMGAIVLIALPLIAVVLTIATIKGIPVFTNLMKALSYFGASQGHGYSLLSWNYDRLFWYHHIIFPGLALACLFYSLYKLKERLEDEKNGFLALAIPFLTAFYFMNAQRGLVRHSMIEGVDEYFSSFIFFILPALVFFVKGLDRRIQLFLFVGISFLFVHNFKFPDAKGQRALYEKFQQALRKPTPVKPSSSKIQRWKENKTFAKENYQDFKLFMDENFSKKASFIDFSNTPMLYFYTQRKVPSYFNQYLQNTLTEDLQVWNIDLLKEMEIPVVVYSNFPETWFDHTDDVPNALRYNKLADYIYSNYKPYGAVGKHFLWLKKDIRLEEEHISKADSTFIEKVRHYKLRKLPMMMGTSNWPEKQTIIKEFEGEMPYHFDIAEDRSGHYLKMEIENYSGGNLYPELELWRDSVLLGGYSFEVPPTGARAFTVPLSNQPNYYLNQPNKIQMKWEKGKKPGKVFSAELIKENKK